MTKLRLSTTVDRELLTRARGIDPAGSDASMLEQALLALIDLHRRVEIDALYDKAWSDHPIDEPDEWGDLASFSEAVRR